MKKEEAQQAGFAVEPYGGGFILCDYSGRRGRFGAAYRGVNMGWQDQPMIRTPYSTEVEARESIDENET